MYDYVPTRYVSQAEAKHRGWRYFWEGKICKYHHTAARYTSNHYQCVDCARVKEGQQPVYPKAPGEPPYAARQYKQPEPKTPGAAGAALPVPKAPEPTSLEKEFLAIYAECREFDKAAKMVGQSPAVMVARLSWSTPFKQACADLETRLMIPRTVPEVVAFEWDEDKRARLLEVWIDTGDLATGLEAIRVTPAEFFRELERNSPFATRYEKAEVLANKALEWRAKQLALAGNDKLLTLVLKASDPKYKESLKVEMSVTDKLTDEQLRERIRALRKNQEAIDGEFTVVGRDEPQRIAGGVPAAGSSPEAGGSQSIRDLL